MAEINEEEDQTYRKTDYKQLIAIRKKKLNDKVVFIQ